MHADGTVLRVMSQVFSNDINKAIAKAAEYYEKMQYHEVRSSSLDVMINITCLAIICALLSCHVLGAACGLL